jgi:hypothetical protein
MSAVSTDKKKTKQQINLEMEENTTHYHNRKLSQKQLHHKQEKI